MKQSYFRREAPMILSNYANQSVILKLSDTEFYNESQPGC